MTLCSVKYRAYSTLKAVRSPINWLLMQEWVKVVGSDVRILFVKSVTDLSRSNTGNDDDDDIL